MGSVLAPSTLAPTSSLISAAGSMILTSGAAAFSRGGLRRMHPPGGRGSMQVTHATLNYAPAKSRRRTRGRRGSSGDSGSSGDEDDFWMLSGGGGDDDGGGGGGGNGGGSGGSSAGRWWDRSWGSGDANHWLTSIQRHWEQALYEVGWVWLALSMMSMLSALHFVQSCILGPGGSVPKADVAS